MRCASASTSRTTSSLSIRLYKVFFIADHPFLFCDASIAQPVTFVNIYI